MSTKYNPLNQMLFEALGFFIIVFAYYMTIIEKKATKYIYAPVIGSMYFVACMYLIEKTGACLNPARLLGLCLMANYYQILLIEFFGCLIGAVFGSLLGSLMLSESPVTAVVSTRRKTRYENAD